ncbi:MAG: hypothetical protein QOJ42_1912, partial [Acidobacteriaceae bacterium]|nr:hypothetical protein [Acidobacteriaceae bacterium]
MLVAVLGAWINEPLIPRFCMFITILFQK